MDRSRRDLMLQGLFGAGLLGLRSLATGLPLSYLLHPRTALAGEAGAPGPANTAAQYVIFSTSGNGDPVNANVPGTYGISGTGNIPPPIHPPSMTTTPWLALPSSVFGRTVFFHHATYTVVHPDEGKVLHLMNAAPTAEMFPSMLAAQLAPQLGTIQTQPVALGPETISYQNRPQPSLSPVALADILGSEAGPLGQLQGMRDKYLDKMNAIARSQGNRAQQSFIDQYALSQRQAREISQSLIQTLSTIKSNNQDAQALAAVTLIRMNVAPVMTIHLDFGGDNHTDTGLANETAQTTAGIASIATLMANLQSVVMPDGVTTLADRVTFVSLNVFGRTLVVNNDGTTANGRTHQGNHHCTVIIGKPFQGQVIGGIEPDTTTKDYRAQPINLTSGAGITGGAGDAGSGAVGFAETFNSMAKTVCAGVGVSPTFYNNPDNILSGQVIPPALVPT
jgi:hypothetical protein